MTLVEPMACRWCDVPKREHCNRYRASAGGWHTWTQPEPWQVKARMERRRLHSGRPLPKRWTTPVPPPPMVCDHSGPYEVETDADGWPVLVHPCGCREGYRDWWPVGEVMAITHSPD